jgi:DNA/RNA-binding domain of Phe-tRNA-synthetase-like protein
MEGGRGVSAGGRPQPGCEGGSDPTLGWSAREVQEELPGLRLLLQEVELDPGVSVTDRSPAHVAGRLRELSNRFRGPRAVGLRTEPVPSAYRVFFRQIGLDPEVARTPIEAAALERMLRGGFLPGGLLEDLLLIALVDTGVSVRALDADRLDGPLGIRPSREGEPMGRSPEARLLPAGQLVIADASAALAVLFGELAAGHEPTARTRRLVLFAVQVAGVPTLFVEESLWTVRSALQAPA